MQKKGGQSITIPAGLYMYDITRFDEEKETLTKKLSEQYSRSIINMEEYERILEYINKIETRKEINIINQIILGNATKDNELIASQNEALEMEAAVTKERRQSADQRSADYLSAFSWRTTNVKPINGNGGRFTSLFGANRIIVDNLPKGKTIINVNSIFGLTEIIVSENVKITNRISPVFSGIFGPRVTNKENEDLPELCITGKAVFGNITIIVQ